MTSEEEMHALLFGIRRSVRYHMHRCRFYDNFHDISTAFTVMLGIGAIYTTLSDTFGSGFVVTLGALISVIGILDLVIGSTRKARLHNSLANKFSTLEKALLSSSANVKRAELARLDIEKEEPPVLSVLDVICHNEVMVSMGYERNQLAKVGWFQRLASPFFDFMPHTLG